MAYDRNKEIMEALEAGNRALQSLKKAQGYLDSARGWGLWDIFGGGGLFTSAVKHSKMGNAKQSMREATYYIANFAKELRDVENTCNLDIRTDGFVNFVDVFCDDFLFDLVVQNRINQARAEVQKAAQMIKQVCASLEAELYTE